MSDLLASSQQIALALSKLVEFNDFFTKTIRRVTIGNSSPNDITKSCPNDGTLGITSTLDMCQQAAICFEENKEQSVLNIDDLNTVLQALHNLQIRELLALEQNWLTSTKELHLNNLKIIAKCTEQTQRIVTLLQHQLLASCAELEAVINDLTEAQELAVNAQTNNTN